MNARTCKHIKSLFGDKYEEARLKLKNPNRPPPKSTAEKSAPVQKAKAASKRRKADEREVEEDSKPVKKLRSTSSARSRDQQHEDNDSRKGREPSPRKKVDDDNKHDEGEKSTKKAHKPAPGGGKDKEDEDDALTTSKAIPDLLLANKWDVETGPDPTGWWISEKLDGVRYDHFRAQSHPILALITIQSIL